VGVDLPLKTLCGERIVQVAAEKIGEAGFERIILRSLSGASYEFKAREIYGERRDLYTDEFYTLDMQAANGQGSFEVCDCDLPVGRVERLKSDEWTEATDVTPGTIGLNPRIVCSALVGAAPPEASPVTVTSGVVLYSAATQDALLISHTDFPGLLRFCSARNEIDEFRAKQTIEDVSSCGPRSCGDESL
jgi:hypothetical protein